MHMRCIKWQGFHTIPSTIMLQQSRLFCIILKEHGTKAFIYPQIGHLSSPVMLIHTLEYYFGSKILKILHQSNQELGISLSLECSYPMGIKTSNSSFSFYHGSRTYCFMPFNAWSLLLREVIKEIYIRGCQSWTIIYLTSNFFFCEYHALADNFRLSQPI